MRGMDTLKMIDEMLDHIVKRPRMYAVTHQSAEDMVGILLLVRDSLTGKSPTERETTETRRYYAEHYPEVPGPIRCITAAAERGGHGEDWWSEEMKKYVDHMRYESTCPDMTKEEIYDAKIRPLMSQIINTCQTEGINMMALFSLGDGFCTTYLPHADAEDSGVVRLEDLHNLMTGKTE